MCVRNLHGLPVAGGCAGDNGDGPVRAAASEHQTVFMRGPGDTIDRTLVSRVLVDLGPLAVLLAPYNDAAIVAAGGDEIAVYGVGPTNSPHGTLVAEKV